MNPTAESAPPAHIISLTDIVAAVRDASSPERMLSKTTVKAMVDMGDTELWRALERGDFPQPRLRSPGRLAWLESEVTAWIRARPLAPKMASPNKAAARATNP